jgi:hypothetical protein
MSQSEFPINIDTITGFEAPSLADPQEGLPLQPEDMLHSFDTAPVQHGLLRKLGRGILDLPGNAYSGLQTSAASFRENPIHYLKSAGEAAVVTAELLPVTNEGGRYGAFVLAEALSHRNPAVGALVFGGATFAYEGGAAVVMANVLARKEDNKLLSKIDGSVNKILDFLHINKEAKTSNLTKVGATLAGGSIVSIYLKDREESGRTAKQNLRYGLKMASLGTAVCTAQGAAMAEGVRYPNPATIGAAVMGLAGLRYGAKWIAKRGRTENNTTDEQLVETDIETKE